MELRLFDPQPELRFEGRTTRRTASALLGAAFIEGRYQPAPLGLDETGAVTGELWRDPHKGILMLRPSPFRRDYFTSPAWRPTFLNRVDWHHTNGDLIDFNVIADDPTSPKVLATLRRNRDFPLEGTDPPIGFGTLPLEPDGLTWTATSKAALAPNEGFSIYFRVNAATLATGTTLFAVAFGGMWCLFVDSTGGARLYQRSVDGATTSFVLRHQFTIRPAGIANRTAMQLTVIPWGIDGIAFLANEDSRDGSGRPRVDLASRNEQGFLVETRRLGYEAPWNTAMRQFIKTEAGAIGLAFPAVGIQVSFLVSRVRYAPAGFALMPDWLDQPRPGQTPTTEAFGYWGQRRTSTSAGGTVLPFIGSAQPGLFLSNPEGTAWNSNEDTGIVTGGWLVPSDDGIYTPELWAVETRARAETFTPGGEPVLAEGIRRVSGTLSAEPEANMLKVVLADELARAAPDLMTLGGRMLFTLDEQIVFEGHFSGREARLEGGFVEGRTAPGLTTHLRAEGLWAVADRTPASHFPALGPRTFGSLIREVFSRMGVPSDQVSVTEELDLLEIDGFTESQGDPRAGTSGLGVADDWKIVHENASLGDLLRALTQRFRAQGQNGRGRELRIVRENGQWRAYLAAEWDPDFSNPWWFLLDESLFEGKSDAELRETGWVRALGAVRLHTRLPRTNQLSAYASIGSGTGADAVAAFIAPAPLDLSNFGSPNFAGALYAETFGPPETALASTPNELDRMARSHFDRVGRPARFLQMEAEWWAAIQPGQFAVLLGRNAAGEAVSYGAWRIETIGFEVKMLSNSYDVRADYALRFEAPFAPPDFEMLGAGWSA